MGSLRRGWRAGPAALIFGGISVSGVSNMPWAWLAFLGRARGSMGVAAVTALDLFPAWRGFPGWAWPRPSPAPPRSRARQSPAMARVCIAVLALSLLLGASPRGGGEAGVAGVAGGVTGSRGSGGGLAGVALRAAAIPRPQLRRERTLAQSRSFPCRSPSRTSRKEPEGQPLPCCRSAAGDAQLRSIPCLSSAAAARGPLPGRRPLFSLAAGRAGPRAGRGRGNPRGGAQARSGGEGVRPGDAPGAAAGEWPGRRGPASGSRVDGAEAGGWPGPAWGVGVGGGGGLAPGVPRAGSPGKSQSPD